MIDYSKTVSHEFDLGDGVTVTTQVPVDLDADKLEALAKSLNEEQKGAASHGERAAKARQEYAEEIDPKNELGGQLYQLPVWRDIISVIDTAHPVSKSAISQQRTSLREGFDPSHPWYLDPSRPKTTGRPASSKQVTFTATSSVQGTEQGEELSGPVTTRGMVSAATVKLRQTVHENKRSELGRNPSHFLNDLKELEEAVKLARQYAIGVMRSH